jgi:hypothetical protein
VDRAGPSNVPILAHSHARNVRSPLTRLVGLATVTQLVRVVRDREGGVAQHLLADYGRILCYDRADSAEQVAFISARLKTQWGIP